MSKKVVEEYAEKIALVLAGVILFCAGSLLVILTYVAGRALLN